MDHRDSDADAFLTLRAALIMLCFGLGILAFLIVIERPHWFRMRPVSTGAAAMSRVATGNAQSASNDAPVSVTSPR